MDAWETLVASSTLSSGDAWERVNTLSSGDGGILLVDSMNLELDTQAVNVVVSDTEEFNVSLEDGQLYLDVVIEFMELPA